MAVSLLDELAKHGSVTLEGYRNQVGGQYRVMKFGDCVCKPLVLRESKFYQSLSEELKQFTAAYHGVITVCFERQSSGDINVVAYPHQAGGSVLAQKALKVSTGVTATSLDGERVSVGSDQSYASPWYEQCTKVSTEKLNALGEQLDTVQQEYIALENLTSRFTRPSILDLKVGSGNHDDYTSEEKRLKNLKTKQNSTTRTLHVRMSGMQKYNAARKEYMFRDKYYGRALTKDGFREELRLFLHNGVQFRADLLTNIIFMLEELVSVVQRQDSYRFYSSSLLIIYDGAEGPKERRGTTRTNGVSPHELHMPSNEENGQPEQPHLNGASVDTPEHHTSPTHLHCNRATLHDSHMATQGQRSKLSDLRENVDIRMIDFAHGVHGSFAGPVEGCDEDFLCGLKALLRTFKELQTH